MKSLLAIVLFATALSVRAQVAINPFQALHPIMKDPNNRNAPTSLNQDPDAAQEYQRNSVKRQAPTPSSPSAQPPKPFSVVARIDDIFAVSPISLLGTVNGLKGRLYVTNIGTGTASPTALFAVCDQKGFLIGTSTKAGGALGPNDFEKIEILATNLNATDVKLVKMTARK